MGRCCERPGYDPATGFYLTANGHLDPIPDRPSAAQVDAAREFLLERFLHDFPWRSPADRANYLALLVTPLIRPFTNPLSPFGMIEASMPGSGNTMPVRAAVDPDVLRALQRAVTRRLDGKKFAPSVARKTRGVLFNALDYAVEKKLIDANPLTSVKWTAMPKGKRKVDRRAVPNPTQARALLAGIGALPRSGPRLEAFFAAMYYAGLRPEEAVSLNKRNVVSLPDPVWSDDDGGYVYGWGTFRLDKAEPHAGGRWTDSGKPRDDRPLKSRDDDAERTVSFPPDLTRLLHRHILRYGYGPDGRLFRAEQGGEIPMITYTRAWRAVRKVVLTEEQQQTPLAARPYDLRHAAVSTQLVAGVDPASVAEWAGHSVGVLFEVYAAFLDGGEEANRARIEKILGHKPRNDPEG
ncbi:hypothetical protein [Amycolatopsis sp. NPDC051716]|uniref:tyrosine-type recombinase/integrase n=1 Tax=Amycolatopsis sp. NPDC051716 TaxID=3155804 RepID=UPI0034325B3D